MMFPTTLAAISTVEILSSATTIFLPSHLDFVGGGVRHGGGNDVAERQQRGAGAQRGGAVAVIGAVAATHAAV